MPVITAGAPIKVLIVTHALADAGSHSGEPVQDTVYIVLPVGLTLVLPFVAPPVLNPLPVQDDACVDVHVRVTVSPELMIILDCPLASRAAVGGKMKGLNSEHEAEDPPFEPLHVHVHLTKPSALSALVPRAH